MQSRHCPDKDFSDNLVPKPWASAQGEAGAKVSFMHGLKGSHRTSRTVCRRESQARSSPLCCTQTSSLSLGRARRYIDFIFDGNNHWKSLNGKK